MKYAKGTVINDTLYIGGGYCTTVNDDYFMFSYKLIDDQWMRLPLLPQGYGVPTNISNGLCYIGGRDYSTSRVTNKVITLQHDHWVTQYASMITAREDHAVVTYQHYTIVAGGYGKDGSTLDTTEVFNHNNNQWTTLSTHLPEPMRYINATTCNQSFIIAGYGSADDYANSGTFIISMDSLVGADQQSLTSSTSEDNNKWSQLYPTPYWNTAIVPNTSPPVIIGGDDNQSKATEKTLIIQELMHLNVILYQYIHFFVFSEVLGRWWCTEYI